MDPTASPWELTPLHLPPFGAPAAGAAAANPDNFLDLTSLDPATVAVIEEIMTNDAKFATATAAPSSED